MRANRSIKDSLKEYLNWCVSRLLLGGSRNDTVRDMVDAISDEIASGGGVVSQDQLDQTVQDITKSYGIADQTVLTSAESYTDQKIADVVDGSPEALDTLYELAKALGDDSNFATTVMDQIGQKLPTTTFENFIDNKAWTKDNLTKLSQLINNINSIKAGTRVESMDVNLASMSSYLRYDLFDANTTGTKPGNLTTGFLLTFSWDNGGWGAQIAISNGNIDGAIFLRTIKDSESDKIWGPWVKVWNSNNFNPDNKFGLSGIISDLNNAPLNAVFSTNGTPANAPLENAYFQGFTFAMDNNPDFKRQWAFKDKKIWFRNLHAGSWSAWTDVIPPDNYLPLSGGSITGGLGVSGYLTAGVLRVKATSYPQISFVNTTTNRDSLLFVNGSGLYWRPTAGTATDYQVYHSGNFNPGNYLLLSGGTMTGDITFGSNGRSLRGSDGGNIAGVLYDTPNARYVTAIGTGSRRLILVSPASIYRGAGGVAENYMIYDSGNFNPSSKLDKSVWDEAFELKTVNGVRVISAKLDFLSVAGISAYATTSQAGLMSAADKTKLDGLSGGGLNIPAYIFPGDPSKLDSSASSTHITSILGTAIDLLDAFNNGRVFISKTVTFNEVQVPSDITYSLLKSIDPDNPTIFQIIMSTVVWGHYIEITIDFENNEYQAINNTINGSISVNTSGTSN